MIIRDVICKRQLVDIKINKLQNKFLTKASSFKSAIYEYETTKCS